MLESGVVNQTWKEILTNKLEHFAWFKNSVSEVKKQLLLLGEANPSLIEKIIKFESSEKNIEVLRINKIMLTKNLVILDFQLRSTLNNQLSNKEIVLEKEIDTEMGQGLIFVSSQGKIEWIITENNLGSIKMKFPSFSTGKTLYLPAKLEKWLKNTFNEKEIIISKFIDLGETETLIFAAIIDSQNQTEVNLNESYEIYKINEIDKIIEESKDSIVISVLSRLKLKKVI